MKGELLTLAALAMFSTNIILTRVAAARLSLNAGFLIVVSVNIAFAALLFGVQQATRHDTLRWDSQGVVLFALAGLFATYLGRWFIMESIARLGPAKASAFQISSPLFTFLIAWLFLGERLRATAVLAMALTAAGLLLVSLSGMQPSAVAGADSTGPKPGRVRRARAGLKTWLRSGVLLAVGSSAAYAVGNVLRGAAIRQWNEAVLGALIGALAGIALHLMFGTDHVNVLRSLRGADRTGVVLFAFSGVLTISAQMCVIVAMRATPVAVVALITLCTPLLVFPLSYFLLRNDEGINGRTLMGAVLTLAGISAIILL